VCAWKGARERKRKGENEGAWHKKPDAAANINTATKKKLLYVRDWRERRRSKNKKKKKKK
jgi:hypothetical protein